jgi:hypothetical protein
MEVTMTKPELAAALIDLVHKLQVIIDSIDDEQPAVDSIPAIPFKDDPEFEIPDAWLCEWYQRYGEVFVRRELVKCRHWCLDNPAKQKFAGKKGSRPKGFIGGWLGRAAERKGHFVGKVSTVKKYARKTEH